MYDHLLLTQEAWTIAFMLAGFQMGVLVLGGYLRLTILLFRKHYTAIGIVFAVLFCFWYLGLILGLIVGWWKAKRWSLRGFMAFWSAMIALMVLNFALGAIMGRMKLDEWQHYFGWLPGF